jgi:hypothetical protein
MGVLLVEGRTAITNQLRLPAPVPRADGRACRPVPQALRTSGSWVDFGTSLLCLVVHTQRRHPAAVLFGPRTHGATEVVQYVLDCTYVNLARKPRHSGPKAFRFEAVLPCFWMRAWSMSPSEKSYCRTTMRQSPAIGPAVYTVFTVLVV